LKSKEFTKQFLFQIQPGWKIIDVGAGNGHFSRLFVERGAIVTAIEPSSKIAEEESIQVIRTNVEDFIRTDVGKYDAVFIRNVIQFLSKDWVYRALFPWIDTHLVVNGLIGVETFFKEPSPPFENSIKSLYGLKELADEFPGWQILLKDEYEHYDSDMRGKKRLFYATDLIMRKVAPKEV
jgi:cyclopropane fatty-acyl-phospholipid synthase-like methyltransferase